MKKIFLAIVLLGVIVALTACGQTTTIKTDEGESVTTTVTGTEGADSWCPEGGDWSAEWVSEEGAGEATWKVDKLITSGKYAGLCHVIYTATTPEGKAIVDYYFSEDGESGYFEMEMNGQKITQELHAP